MGTNRTGRSLPSGPATTPQASSGWSRRAWATIASRISAWMRSTKGDDTGHDVPGGGLTHQGRDDRVLDHGQPVVDQPGPGLRVGGIDLALVLAHPDAGAERQPQ